MISLYVVSKSKKTNKYRNRFMDTRKKLVIAGEKRCVGGINEIVEED